MEVLVKYQEIADDLRQRIIDKLYLQGEQLPLEKEMCKMYGVSRITVKKAVDRLVHDGLVIKRRGAGTFVKSVNDQAIKELSTVQQFNSFTENNKNQVVSSKVLKFEIVHPTLEIASKLQIQQDDFVYDIIRVRYADKEPIVVEYVRMPIDIVAGLKRDTLFSSVYAYIQNKLDLKIQSAHRSIRALLPNEIEQENLNIQAAFPVLEIEQTAYLDDGRAFEYSVSRHRSDKIVYKSLSIRG